MKLSQAEMTNRSITIQSQNNTVDSNRIINKQFKKAFDIFQKEIHTQPLLLHGNAIDLLNQLPDSSVDCVLTSPPYWGKREYENGGIGLEKDYRDYISNLSVIFLELKRVLKPEGSFWLNIGDSFNDKSLIGIPWRIAFELTDHQNWILRNSVIWNKLKGGMDNSKDRLGSVHENIFHFVKKAKGYYFDADAIRSKPRKSKIVNGAIVSATGVSGVRYKRQIELSTSLSDSEKVTAMAALEKMLNDIRLGHISDFRMVIRGQQRTTHSDSEKISGRAKELRDKGFYFLKYHPNGCKPNDVWDILPEDTQNRKIHFSPFPVELCFIPLLATCPKGGTVLDPFCGTGTTLVAARSLGRKSIGIDISSDYLELAKERLA
ncbi:site-specific DNA-methyltransferase (adenine-specific) [Nitrosomonas marina]|uniref:Methyltransferase n=1 Tax=Nitrosomonas marina TaxID=917 RepID=A0A1I0FVW1_9PROT|nr:site-specific DNA-methyltransferase [Nitrosomonas marina]SET61797.1 site-specific DNA-methyltransferase (adenine-specific) [Nitrosomonas marina]